MTPDPFGPTEPFGLPFGWVDPVEVLKRLPEILAVAAGVAGSVMTLHAAYDRYVAPLFETSDTEA